MNINEYRKIIISIYIFIDKISILIFLHCTIVGKMILHIYNKQNIIMKFIIATFDLAIYKS